MSTKLKIVQSLQHGIRRYQLLKANSLSVVGRTPRRVEASDPCIYVQQREVGSETLSWKTSVWSKFSGRCHCPGRWHADLGKRGRHNLPYRCSQVGGLNSHLHLELWNRILKSLLKVGCPSRFKSFLSDFQSFRFQSYKRLKDKYSDAGPWPKVHAFWHFMAFLGIFGHFMAFWHFCQKDS